MRILLAHDYLTQHGGAERVALELASALSAEKIVTSCFVPSNTFAGFKAFNVQTTFLQRFRFIRQDPRRGFPLLSMAWLALHPVARAVIVCSSSGWSHLIRADRSTRKIVYCHNPARWLYQPEDYFIGVGRWFLVLWHALSFPLKVIDKRAATGADLYLANSSSVAARIFKTYGIRAEVLHPPVLVDPSAVQTPVPHLPDNFFLTVGRSRGYKNTGVLTEAFAQLPAQTLVVVGDSDTSVGRTSNIIYLGRVADAELRYLYANATALISVSRQDFGLTPIEANAFGTPALVVKDGGFLDTMSPGVNGDFIDSADEASVIKAVENFGSSWDSAIIRTHAMQFSPKEFREKLLRLLAPYFVPAAEPTSERRDA